MNIQNILIGTGSLVLLLIVLVVYFYNALVKKTKLAEEGWSGIDVQLKRRYDLIPNLVETVKGYAKHEKTTLAEVIKLRNECQQMTNIEEKSVGETKLSGILRTVFALAEQYPDLKANTNFKELQGELMKIEDEIQLARRYYNATVRDLNILVSSFPSNIVAKKYGFTEKPFFELDSPEERKNVSVKF